ncbi:MAG: 16S rRNA (uracil(1498)-N(3))-methyltransferase [Clostridia bacterium]|nr:16S rRNA (uracil(1498)-N(3))-methyltransferase [Clostridia bacterium]
MAFIPRLFIASDSISGGRALVTGSDRNHIINVLRKTAGDTVTVCDMHANSYEAVIERVEEDSVVLLLGEKKHCESELPFPVTVYQCLPKGEKSDDIVRKAVELGAKEIVFVASERCVARPDEKTFAKRRERLLRISESAAAQCGRSYVPEVRGLINYAEAIKEISASGKGFVCYEGDGTVPLRGLLCGEPGSMAFLIGPEGGLSEKETGLAVSAGLPLVNLGKRILRTETAALYVLAGISVNME